MSHWKLVEAVPEEPVAEPAPAQPEPIQDDYDTAYHQNLKNDDYRSTGRGSGRGRGRGEGSGRGRGRSSTGRGRGSPRYQGQYRSKADRSYFSYLAVQQIDQIFNPDSLCIDTFVRTYMDEAGFVPVALVATYQNVAQYNCTYNDIVNKLKETAIKCKFIELDADNETVRLKEGWEKFVMPNPFGGRGLPRYIKQAAEVPQQEYYYDYSMAAAGGVQYDYPYIENQEEQEQPQPQEETTAENEEPVEVEAAPAAAVDNQA